MERCLTKSGIIERAETVGSVGFLISSCVVGSSPIFWASLFFSSSSRTGLNNAIEMQSTVRYQVCCCRTTKAAPDTFLSTLLNVVICLQSWMSLVAALVKEVCHQGIQGWNPQKSGSKQ